MNLRTTISIVTGLALAACSVAAAAGSTSAPTRAVTAGPVSEPSAVKFRMDGSLERPAGYRSWVYVGAPLTPNELNDGKAAFPEFHSVYIDPASYEAYKRTGEWRDGTVLLKELISVGAKSSTSGKGYFMGEFLGLEAVVKSAERFPDEPGHWGFFRFTDEAGGPVHRTAEVLPTAACACRKAASRTTNRRRSRDAAARRLARAPQGSADRASHR